MFKCVLTFYSGYFAKALNERYVEGQENNVKLASEDPKLFRFFQHWTHTRQFYDSTLLPGTLFDLGTLAKLWAFGAYYEAPMFQNAVMDVIIGKMRDSRAFFETATIEHVFDNTQEDSPLRRLLVQTLSELLGWGWDWSLQGLDHTLVEDVVDAAEGLPEIGFNTSHLAKVFASLGSGPRWHCMWHVHGVGESCLPLAEG